MACRGFTRASSIAKHQAHLPCGDDNTTPAAVVQARQPRLDVQVQLRTSDNVESNRTCPVCETAARCVPQAGLRSVLQGLVLYVPKLRGC